MVHLSLITFLRGKHYYSHFIEDEIEALNLSDLLALALGTFKKVDKVGFGHTVFKLFGGHVYKTCFCFCVFGCNCSMWRFPGQG